MIHWNREYAAAADLRFIPSMVGTLSATTSLRTQDWDLPAEAVSLLAAFAIPKTPTRAFEELNARLGMPREQFQAVAELCVQIRALRAARADARSPGRQRVFQEAAMAFLRGGSRRPFPLRSSLPLQDPVIFYPGLSAREVHDKTEYEWVSAMEAAAPVILEELKAFIRQRGSFAEVYQQVTNKGQWAAAYFWVYGHRVAETCDACPETAKVLESTPGYNEISTSLFSVLAPRTRVAPHCGRTNAKIRCQLPLIVPERCGLRVGDVSIPQEEGKCLVFDDSFFHTAWNESDQPRFVLLFDFYHPDLSTAETKQIGSLTLKSKTHKSYLEPLKDSEKPDWVYRVDGL